MRTPTVFPTDKENTTYFGTHDDDTDPASGKYYQSATYLPRGLNFITGFDYPKEKSSVMQVYIHFPAWVQSSGSQYPDWYMNLPGYRTSSNIY